VEKLEDEAAAPDAELVDGCFAVSATEAGAPLDVQPTRSRATRTAGPRLHPFFPPHIATDSYEMEIGLPMDVQHVAHITFDRFHGFLGLPC
jgi:hypothetical protein